VVSPVTDSHEEKFQSKILPRIEEYAVLNAYRTFTWFLNPAFRTVTFTWEGAIKTTVNQSTTMGMTLFSKPEKKKFGPRIEQELEKATRQTLDKIFTETGIHEWWSHVPKGTR